ncbi:hypothetical protein GMST_07310 [Geomonas silvestris]|uniref:SF4 helicase domain-containing protein n=1 Tax=Geomonas silvestris TaxID=2740184 RepID=A0A6V8MEI0_9BACT|nr:replicative DNA helicase [Geomonas silvestris]GFO58406.1 hypothetical protein GMST_07310 [Geomonas silvestris]
MQRKLNKDVDQAPPYNKVSEVLKKSIRKIESRYESPKNITGAPSGYVDLDLMTGGFQPGDLVVIAGRPSMGKTSLALNIANSVAIEAEGVGPVGIITLESTEEQVTEKLLCALAGVNINRLRSGRLTEVDWPKLTKAAGRLHDSPIFVKSAPNLALDNLINLVRGMKNDQDVRLVIVDYLQLMPSVEESRTQGISNISRSLKGLALELGISVLLLSQVNRSLELRNDKRPKLMDLRDSGSVEEDADIVLFVYRDEVYEPSNDYTESRAEIIVAKQRKGDTGLVNLGFLPDSSLFVNLPKD